MNTKIVSGSRTHRWGGLAFAFGILTLRRSVLHHWHWLPLVTGLMGLIGFFVFRGEEITAIFLLFRTLFALGLIGLGVLLWMEPENLPVGS